MADAPSGAVEDARGERVALVRDMLGLRSCADVSSKKSQSVSPSSSFVPEIVIPTAPPAPPAPPAPVLPAPAPATMLLALIIETDEPPPVSREDWDDGMICRI